jgi:hypothetical protein
LKNVWQEKAAERRARHGAKFGSEYILSAARDGVVLLFLIQINSATSAAQRARAFHNDSASIYAERRVLSEKIARRLSRRGMAAAAGAHIAPTFFFSSALLARPYL